MDIWNIKWSAEGKKGKKGKVFPSTGLGGP
jgi:hypothetical protein